MGQSYQQVEDKRIINPLKEELIDTSIKTKTTHQVSANNSPPKLTLSATTTIQNKPDLLLRLHQAIEANVPIVTGWDPNVLDNIGGTGFAQTAHW